jgi:hypothetical protein
MQPLWPAAGKGAVRLQPAEIALPENPVKSVGRLRLVRSNWTRRDPKKVAPKPHLGQIRSEHALPVGPPSEA